MKTEKAMIFLSLCMIAVGLMLIYPPSCPLVIGLLLWIDLSIESRQKGKFK